MKGAKVRRMWAKDMIEGWGAHKEILQCVTSQPCRLDHGYLPVFIVPATPEVMEALVEKAARAILGHPDYKPFRRLDAVDTRIAHEVSRAALSAVFGKGGK